MTTPISPRGTPAPLTPTRLAPVLLTIALLASVLAGCAGSQPVADLDLRLEAARHAFGGRFEYLSVQSAGDVADKAFINVSRATGPSNLARELGAKLAPAARGARVRLLVTGPVGAKNVQVVSDALEVAVERPLGGLELLYLGEPADGEQVRRLIQEAGGRYRFAPYAD
jgi:hypothetical protein